ncbi:non-homologous end-joining DNA ligase [Maribacter sp. ACAM166]|uniref:non-homologous end-joining DNA ligase n=1 Tax=Maribacter sp. ACAM166 TaxID=2508996 RepID=UPI0010FE4A92|nr:non-homologous end-joining DNA ligase [Maribacter sp. ACAM166]TLP81733.1 ATP-dependent DNA ligase [Maribacter sp. ACAM166]
MKTLEITHADKVMFPKSKITKGDLAQYYERIADTLLPFMKDRPLTLHRFPEGIHHKGFYQKNASDYFPDWIKTVEIKKEGGWVNHVVCENVETLLYLVNQGVVTFHVTLSKTDKIDYPDKLIFDLDPPDSNFHAAVTSAKLLRGLLEEELGLTTYPMATGSTGLHVVVPICRAENFDEVRDFAKTVARYLANKHPKEFTVQLRKHQRSGKLFIDYLRNSYAQTAVCPFSVRAMEGAPVALPLSWNEVGTQILDAQPFDIHTVFKRLKLKTDPWKDFYRHSQIIGDAKKKLERLMGETTSEAPIS